MELYHLKTFVTVAEEGHLTRAAERLYTSQPAISAHIKALEEELGVTLFLRTPKGMQLTREGEQLFPRAQQTLASAGEFMQFAKGMQDELVGSIRIGLNSDWEHLRLAELQRRLSEHHPKLEQQFLSGMTQVNIPNVRIGRFDAAFISGECNDPQMEVIQLSDTALRIAAPSEWCAEVQGASIKQLAEMPWTITSPDCAYFSSMYSIFDAHDCQPNKTVMCDQEEALLAMIKSGIGLGVVREDIAIAEDKAGEVFMLPIKLPSVALSFIYPKKRANDPLIQAVVNELVAIWGLPEADDGQQQVG